ncbi:MAG: hypothetical protein IT537_03195 [Hyphomicrobiales bacterium]|nr:hypothetical protein [Hyphomicrobiales bacterium]
MSRVLTARDVCSHALAAIGAFTVNDTAPDPIHLQRAMSFLDMLLAETVGTQRMFSRVEAGVLSIPITNGTQSYDLYTILGSSLPADGIQFVMDTWCQDQDGNRYPVEIVNQQKFETVCDPAESGPPAWINLDATASPTLRIFPIPATTDPSTYTLKLQVQKYAPDVAPGGVTGTMPLANVMHMFGQTWQRWMVFQLAHDVGCGPVYSIERERLDRFAAIAKVAKDKLDAFTNRTHETTDPVCEPWQ